MESSANPADVGLSALPDEQWLATQAGELVKLDRSGTTEALSLRADNSDCPVVVVSVRSVRTGEVRRVVLMRVEHNRTYAVVASKGGCDKTPAWYYSLKTNPHVRLQDKAEVGEYLARELNGEERETWWARAVAAWPRFNEYARKADRVIPVLALEPVMREA